MSEKLTPREAELLAALKVAERLLDKLANAVCGNEQLPDCEEFYRGYNAVTRRVRNEAGLVLPDVRAAIRKASDHD